MVTRAALLCGGEILPAHLGLVGGGSNDAAPAPSAVENFDMKENLRLVRAETEKRLIRAALSETKGNKVKAARLLSIDRKALYDKIKTYSLE